MPRERLAWMTSTAIIALLALYLPGSFAQREDDYAFVRTLVDIHRQVSVNYVEGVDETKLREGALAGMLSTLDPYTVYVPPSQQKAFDQAMGGSFEGVGIQLRTNDAGETEIITPIDGSPADKAGTQAGDIILRVSGQDIANLPIDEVTKKIKGPTGTDVTLTVRRVTNERLDLTMKRQEYVLPTIKGFGRNPDNTWNYWLPTTPASSTARKIAYLRITQFTTDTAPAIEPVLRKLVADGMQGLVLDLRNNPGGLLEQATKVTDLFLESGTIVSTKGRNRPEQTVIASAEGTLPNFPIAVIVNERSASASEVLAGALADNRRAVVVGTRSYGKGSVQEIINLDPKSGELKITTAYYYLPSGRCVHRKKDATEWGVDPQIPVPVDESTEVQVWEARLDAENFLPPKTTTPPTPRKPSTTPTPPTPADTQLQQATSTLQAMILLNNRPK